MMNCERTGNRPEANDSDSRRSYASNIPTPDELRALAQTEPALPIATHLYYAQTVTLFAADTGTGKTTAMLKVLGNLSQGRHPWTGSEDYCEPLRSLLVSRDDTTLSLVQKVAPLMADNTWIDEGRLLLIGKDKYPFAFGDGQDELGDEWIGNTIADRKVDLFCIDPYEAFLPSGANVNDDAAAKHMIARSQKIVMETDAKGGSLIHHTRKQQHGGKRKDPRQMSMQEQLDEIRGSKVLVQLSRAKSMLWDLGDGIRLLNAWATDLPPMSSLAFQTATVGHFGVRWDLLDEPPADRKAQREQERRQNIASALLALEPGDYSITAAAKLVLQKDSPSGHDRNRVSTVAQTQAKNLPTRIRFDSDTTTISVLPATDTSAQQKPDAELFA